MFPPGGGGGGGLPIGTYVSGSVSSIKRSSKNFSLRGPYPVSDYRLS